MNEELDCLDVFARFNQNGLVASEEDRANEATASGAIGLSLLAAGVVIELGGRAFRGHFNKAGLLVAAGGAAMLAYGCHINS